MNVALIILAAGKGTRMKSALPKVLHPIAGKPMIAYSVDRAWELSNRPPVVIVGYDAAQIAAAIGERAQFVTQAEQLGTGHAVRQAYDALAGRAQTIIVTYGDMPLLTVETLQRLLDAHRAATDTPVTMLTVVADDPRGFGRVLRDERGDVTAIVEAAVATPEQLAIRELNVGVYCFDADWLWAHLPQIPLSQPKGEYYLTDIVELAAAEGRRVQAIATRDSNETLGINTRVHLAQAEAIMQQRINRKWMLAGVTMINPENIYIEAEVEIGRDSVIYPNSYLQGQTTIGEHCHIGPDTLIRDCQIGNRCELKMSVLEQAIVEDDVDMGPFGHLRKGAHLAAGVHMGNFGEVKNSFLGPGVKMGHFSYMGDAQVGADANIGAGTITCNYDGLHKNKTEIGAGAFIGSDTMLVAPVKIGKRAKTGAGSVVTHDVPDDTLAYGVPARPARSVAESPPETAAEHRSAQ